MRKLISMCLGIPIFCFTLSSCIKPGTYTEVYQCNLRIDGIKGEQVSVEYVGNPIVSDYKINGNIAVPYHAEVHYQHDSKKPLFVKNDELYKIKNTTAGDIYVFYILFNAGDNPVNTNIQKDKYYRAYLTELFHSYRKEDSDPNFIPDEKIQILVDKFEKYISRNELYDDLIHLNYPYIKKLAPGEEYIVRWGLAWD